MYTIPSPELLSTMMTSSNGNIFRVTGPLCEAFTCHQWIPSQRPVRWSFDVFFDLCLNKPLSKQSWGWWFEQPSCSSWRHCNDDIWVMVLVNNQLPISHSYILHFKEVMIQHGTAYCKYKWFCKFINLAELWWKSHQINPKTHHKIFHRIPYPCMHNIKIPFLLKSLLYEKHSRYNIQQYFCHISPMDSTQGYIKQPHPGSELFITEDNRLLQIGTQGAN